jgi:cytosine deaminase
MDIILKNANVAHRDEPVRQADIAMEGGRITAVEANITAEAGQVIECGGRLVSGSLIDAHVHLDAVLAAGLERDNQSGTLHEGIKIWTDFKGKRTIEEIKARARRAVDWEVAQGTGFIRTHADVCDDAQLSTQALIELRDELRDRVDIQIVAFPQVGIESYPGGEKHMRAALDMGADVVGGIPHNEVTREAGVKSVMFMFDEAEKRGLMIDAHCDEVDDSHARFVEVMAEQTLVRGMGGRVTASHCVAMHSYNNAYAYRLMGWIQRSALNVTANPFDNLILQAREDSYPKRRGMTRVKELLAAGVNVGIGHDSIMDPWYPLGRGDMVEAASLTLHVCQMSGAREIDACFDMITWRNAHNLGLEDYGVTPGAKADLVVFDAASKSDVLRLNPARTHVFKGGKLVAQTKPAESTVMGGAVDFTRGG